MKVSTKVLSIRQPWAWFIIHGYKPVENRTWKTNFRGRVYVHAGKEFDHDGFAWIWGRRRQLGLSTYIDFELLTADFMEGKDLYGGIIGTVDIVNCVTSHPSPWFAGPYGFVLENPQPIEFIPMRGQLGFFDFKKGEL